MVRVLKVYGPNCDGMSQEDHQGSEELEPHSPPVGEEQVPTYLERTLTCSCLLWLFTINTYSALQCGQIYYVGPICPVVFVQFKPCVLGPSGGCPLLF